MENKIHSPWSRIINRFIKNKLSLFGLFIIISFACISFLGYLIQPDSSPMANRMVVELRAKKPGFSMKFLLVKKNSHIDTLGVIDKLYAGQPDFYTYVPITSYRFSEDKIIVKPYVYDNLEAEEQQFLLSDVYYSIDNSVDSYQSDNYIYYTDIYKKKHKVDINNLRYDIEANNIKDTTYILGTDLYGRDLLSRLILGSRVSLSVGFMSVLLAMIIGITTGALAGYYGGILDKILSWIINVLWSLPSLLIVIAVSFALGKGFFQVFIAIGLTTWVEVARLVRGQVMSIKNIEYVEAAKVLGFSDLRIIIKCIIPNIIGSILVVVASNFASAMLLEAGLSFLGYGSQPPFPSWGGMIKEHYAYIIMGASHLALFPGLAIMLIVYAFNLVSIGLADAFNVKSK